MLKNSTGRLVARIATCLQYIVSLNLLTKTLPIALITSSKSCESVVPIFRMPERSILSYSFSSSARLLCPFLLPILLIHPFFLSFSYSACCDVATGFYYQCSSFRTLLLNIILDIRGHIFSCNLYCSFQFINTGNFFSVDNILVIDCFFRNRRLTVSVFV